MFKIIIIIAVLVIFWMFFGKLIMNLLSFGLKVVFRVVAVLIGILMVLSIANKTKTEDSLTLDEMKNDTTMINAKKSLSEFYEIGDSVVKSKEWKDAEKKVIEKSKNAVSDSKELYNKAKKEYNK